MSTIDFDEWLKRVFDVPVEELEKKGLFHDSNRAKWDGDPPPVNVGCVTQLFASAEEHLAPYSERQQLWGFQYLFMRFPGREEFQKLDSALQERFFESIFILFEQFMPDRCRNPFDRATRRSMNVICFRCWREIPWVREEAPVNSSLDLKIVNVFERILSIPDSQCQESALLGLGLWRYRAPEATKRALERYLDSGESSEGLCWTARQALHGFQILPEEIDAFEKSCREAFARGVYPGDDRISERSHCPECDEVGGKLVGKTWMELDQQTADSMYGEMPLLHPESFAYFLPGFMIRSLHSQGGLLEFLGYALIPDSVDEEFFLDRAEQFDAVQRKVISHFLELLERNESRFDEGDTRKLKAALEFWSGPKK